MHKEKRKNISLDDIREEVTNALADAKLRKHRAARRTLHEIARKIVAGQYWLDEGEIKVRVWWHPDWYGVAGRHYLSGLVNDYGFSSVKADDFKFLWPAQVFIVKIKDKR